MKSKQNNKVQNPENQPKKVVKKQPKKVVKKQPKKVVKKQPMKKVLKKPASKLNAETLEGQGQGMSLDEKIEQFKQSEATDINSWLGSLSQSQMQALWKRFQYARDAIKDDDVGKAWDQACTGISGLTRIGP